MKYSEIVKIKRNQEEVNRQDIMEALLVLKNPSTSGEVYQYINNKRKDEIQAGRYFDFSGIEEWSQKKSLISLRTVQRHLTTLADEYLVTRKDNRYTLSKKGRRDPRYFGTQFGSQIINNIVPKPDFKLKTIKENLNDLVTIFGSYVVYCCIEATKPKTKSTNYDTEMNEHYENLESTVSWINSAINPASLLHYFLFTFLNQIDDQKVGKLRKLKLHEIKDGKKFIHIDEQTGPKYELDDWSSTLMMFIDEKGKIHKPKKYRDIPINDNFLILDRYENVYTDYEKWPYDEIDLKVYQKLVKSFEELYPEIHRKIKSRPTS